MTTDTARAAVDEDPTKGLCHSHDPSTSHEAIEQLHESGARQHHMEIVLDAVRRNPERTACELMEATGLDEYQVRRRLSDLKQRGLVRHEGKRLCSIKQTCMVTWVAVIAVGPA